MILYRYGDTMKSYIKGKYKRSIYKSDNGYVIGLFKISETNNEDLKEYINKTITFTGYFTELNLDDFYLFYGEIVNNPKYGMQYQVSEFERLKPSDKEGLVAFFSSDLFDGIGPKMALKIVEYLGNDAIDKILEDANCLNMVPKLSTKKAINIYNTLLKYEESNNIIVYLSDLGFNMQDALLIYNFYKSNTITMIEHNIYGIIDDISGISFLKVDEIGRRQGIDLLDAKRIKACIMYIFNNLIFKTGDTYLYYDELKRELFKYLKEELEDEKFKLYIDELRYENKIILTDDKYYLFDIFKAEEKIINKINYLLNKDKKIYKKFDKELKKLEEENNIQYDSNQREAIRKALENNILIITGGPGTGKTTIIKAITTMYQRLNNLKVDELTQRIALLAPTGRASKRISESTLLKATTIHRFLKWNKDNNQFQVNSYNPDYSNFIIIDEASMIDINLFSSLLEGLTNNIQLIIVGDYNQLPSVGPGQVLKDLIESKRIETISLELLYRQDENSYINILADEIKNNELRENFLDSKSDYMFLKCSNESIKYNITNLCNQIISKGYDYKRIQLMAPMYAGINGIDALNKELQNVFNPKDEFKREVVYGDIIFRENDKILQLINMPDENVFNGDIGFIKYIIPSSTSKSKKNEIYVDYDGMLVKYLPKDFNKIKHGYIISIHKSQGSEFEMVLMPISSSYKRMLYRKLIYTGITRAKNKLILLGDSNAFIYAIKNNEEYIRKTDLCNKLKNNV